MLLNDKLDSDCAHLHCAGLLLSSNQEFSYDRHVSHVLKNRKRQFWQCMEYIFDWHRENIRDDYVLFRIRRSFWIHQRVCSSAPRGNNSFHRRRQIEMQQVIIDFRISSEQVLQHTTDLFY